MERVGWDEYFLSIARAVAVRADCTRRAVGAVIVDEDHRILATGYNGSPPGGPSCLKGECPRGRHFPGKERWPDGDTHISVCACGTDWPCPDAVAPGSSYDTGPGRCESVHAEANALLFARASVKGATLYCTDAPCGGCARLIQGAGIARVVIPGVIPEMKIEANLDTRDPKFVEHNKNLYPIEDPPLCERKGCGHYVERHWDPEKKVHAACRTGCGCPALLD